MKNIVYLFLLSFILVSCGPNLYFDEPQPARDTNDLIFKDKFQGIYQSLEDSSTLTISEFKIIQKWDYYLRFSKSEMDSIDEIEFKNDRFKYKDIGVNFTVNVDGDSATVRVQSTKRIFHISKSNILRYYKKTYFLNYKTADNLWKVKIINLNRKGELEFRSLRTTSENISNIKEYTEVDSLYNSYKLKPSKREIRKLLGSNLFVNDSKFIKIE